MEGGGGYYQLFEVIVDLKVDVKQRINNFWWLNLFPAMAYNLLKLTNSQVSITTHKKHKINQNTNQTTRANYVSLRHILHIPAAWFA